MVQGQAIRGTRIGSVASLHAERGDVVGRQSITYWCVRGHQTQRDFALYVEIPQEWDCRRCGWPAAVDPQHAIPRQAIKPYKTHLDYVRERRTEEEAEDILAEALAKRAAVRGEC